MKWPPHQSSKTRPERKRTLAAKSCSGLFWVNGDNDSADKENLNSASSDNLTPFIRSKRDLEDYTRLWVNVVGLQNGLKSGTFNLGFRWKNSSNPVPPIIRVFHAVEADGGRKYLTGDGPANETTANAQVSGEYRKRKAMVGGRTSVLPKSLLSSLGPQTEKVCLLFDGYIEGKAELEVVLLDDQNREIGIGSSVWMELLNIKKMYVRAKATPLDGFRAPFESISSQPSPVPTSFVADPNGHVFLKPYNEDNAVIVYVHGIHGPGESGATAYKSNINAAETVYKRLWHQGFKGRFAFYKWPALNPLPSVTGPALTGFEYNESEYRAWKYGRGLAQFVNSFDKASKNLFAHSQGNNVCGAALTAYGLTVNNYVLSQAAVPAGCYDTSGSQSDPNSIYGYARFWNKEGNWPTADESADLGYRGYLSSLSVSGQVVNFFNSDDYALGAGALSPWELNQELYKPNNITSIRSYAFNTGAPGQPYSLGARCFLRGTHFGVFQERQVVDIHESMSFVARSRSRAVGARSSVGGSIKDEFNLAEAPLAFSARIDDHGAQVARRIQQLWPYYEQLGIKLEVLPSAE